MSSEEVTSFKFRGENMKVVQNCPNPHVVNEKTGTVAMLICGSGSWATNFIKDEDKGKFLKYLFYPPLVKYVLEKYDANETPEVKMFSKEEIKEMISLSKELAETMKRPLDLWKAAFKEVLPNLYVVFMERNDTFTLELSPEGEENILNPVDFRWMSLSDDESKILKLGL